jgi:polysaccharide export outer membrane protein
MTKLFSYISLLFLAGLFTGCSQVLQNVDLYINSEDPSLQEKFNVVEKTLTIREAKSQKVAPYLRAVLRNGRGQNAQPISEKIALKSEFPKNEAQKEYTIGIGDTVTFSRLIENNRSPLKKTNTWPKQNVERKYQLGVGDTLALTLIRATNNLNTTAPISSDSKENGQNVIISQQQNDSTIETKGRVGSDGSVLLLEVGRLEANGKSLNELRSEVRNILIRNGVSPRFQLEIVEFKSQKSYLTINSTSKVIILDDQKTTMRDILTSANFGVKPGVITRIRLQRNSKEFSISLRELYGVNSNNIDIQPDDHIFIEDNSAKVVSSDSVVDHEGNIVFESIGKIKAAGLTLNKLRKNIENLTQRVPDSQNAFQIQITTFASQKALISIQGKPGVLVPITDTPATLAEVLTESGLSINAKHITQISLQREVNTFVFTLSDLLDPKFPDVYIHPNDRLTTRILPYKENKVFILGGVSPQIFKINPANRETLADVLFTSGGPLSASSAKRSEVYLLRGSNPVIAFHLDAQSPTRLIVADAMELRPNDILYVAEQPIISFNRTLATIIPLRLLLRDIQDENIP